MHTLVFVGKMQSGKTSSCNLITGEIMKKKGLVPEYTIDNEGDLIIPTLEDGSKVVWGKFDTSRIDYDFRSWCSNNLWPHVKVFNFADSLKLAVNSLFNIPLEKLYGTNKDKDSLTHILNKNLLPTQKVLGDDHISVRELLIRFAQVCRDADVDCFINNVKRQINVVQSNVSLVGDCRYPNEIYGMKEFGAKLIKLKRNPMKRQGESEIAMNDVKDDEFDLVIPAKFTMEQKNEAVLEFCSKCGVL